MGYKFQFITLAGFHALNYGMFDLAHGYAREGMPAFVKMQQAEFAAAERGFTAVKHQREVGTGYFDDVTQVIQAGKPLIWIPLTSATAFERPIVARLPLSRYLKGSTSRPRSRFRIARAT